MGLALLVALALIAIGIGAMLAQEPRPGRQPDGGNPGRRSDLQSLRAATDVELAEEVLPYTGGLPLPPAPRAEQPAPAPAEPAEEVPVPTGTDTVSATGGAPGTVVVQWDLRGGGEERLRAMLGEERFRATTPCLRVYDTDSAWMQTVELNGQGDRPIITGLEPGRRYLIALERRSPEGLHYLIALSQPVTAP